MNNYRGSCLCGTVKYKVDKIEPNMGHCHCSMCRKFHGAAFATYGEARSEYFHWLEGEQNIGTYIASNGTQRKFCKTCGSSLVFVPSNDNGQLVEFALGTLDTEINEKPDGHIFVDSKAQWYDISDDLPTFKETRRKKR